MKIRITRTVEYNLKGIKKEFCHFDEKFIETRKQCHINKDMCCFLCERPFKMYEWVHLAFFEGKTNEMVCGECAHKYEEYIPVV